MFRIFGKATIISLVILSSCTKEQINNTCADPIGTDDYTATHGTWICFLPDINGCFIFESTTSAIIRSITVQGHIPGTIADAGTTDCLSKVSEKPSSGFVTSVSAELNHAYVVKFPDNTYGRFFIDSVIKNSSGKVTQINITRQYSF